MLASFRVAKAVQVVYRVIFRICLAAGLLCLICPTAGGYGLIRFVGPSGLKLARLSRACC